MHVAYLLDAGNTQSRQCGVRILSTKVRLVGGRVDVFD